jgi:hypothetical protein
MEIGAVGTTKDEESSPSCVRFGVLGSIICSIGGANSG